MYCFLLAKRFIHPGNFFNKDNWPSGFDGVLLSQIVHDWPLDHGFQKFEHEKNFWILFSYYRNKIVVDTKYDKISVLQYDCSSLDGRL